MGTGTGNKPWNESYLKDIIPLYFPFMYFLENTLTSIHNSSGKGKGNTWETVLGKKCGKKTMKMEY